jgi:hypothetical protein
MLLYADESSRESSSQEPGPEVEEPEFETKEELQKYFALVR